MVKALVVPAETIVLEYVSESPALGTSGVHSFVLATVLGVVVVGAAGVVLGVVVPDVPDVPVVGVVGVEAEGVLLLPPPQAVKTSAADAVKICSAWVRVNAMMKPPKNEVSVVPHIARFVQ